MTRKKENSKRKAAASFMALAFAFYADESLASATGYWSSLKNSAMKRQTENSLYSESMFLLTAKLCSFEENSPKMREILCR
jgi:hypothetical protein